MKYILLAKDKLTNVALYVEASGCNYYVTIDDGKLHLFDAKSFDIYNNWLLKTGDVALLRAITYYKDLIRNIENRENNKRTTEQKITDNLPRLRRIIQQSLDLPLVERNIAERP